MANEKPFIKNEGMMFGFTDDEKFIFDKHGLPWPPNVVPMDSVPPEERAKCNALNWDLHKHRHGGKVDLTDIETSSQILSELQAIRKLLEKK